MSPDIQFSMPLLVGGFFLYGPHFIGELLPHFILQIPKIYNKWVTLSQVENLA